MASQLLRFETEAWGNWKMAYFVVDLSFLIISDWVCLCFHIKHLLKMVFPSRLQFIFTIVW